MFVDVFYTQPVPPHPVSMLRWETSLIFGNVYVKGQKFLTVVHSHCSSWGT